MDQGGEIKHGRKSLHVWGFMCFFPALILGRRDQFGEPFWHLGSTLGAILAPGDHPGGPWEQQDGHEVANNRIFVDFGMISGPVYVSFWNSKYVKNRFLF